MRSFDRAMPEELNRVLTDHASSLLLCSSEAAALNLRAERVAGRIEVVGDVMVDIALLLGPSAADRTEVLDAHGVTPGEFVLVTAHRAGNVDDPARLERLVELLEALPAARSSSRVHPRTRARLEAAGLLDRLPLSSPPLGYLEFTALPAARARGADRLRRRAEGGLPRRRRRASRCAPPPSGPRRSRRAGTCSSTSTPPPRWPRCEREPPARAAAALRRRPGGRARRGRA